MPEEERERLKEKTLPGCDAGEGEEGSKEEVVQPRGEARLQAIDRRQQVLRVVQVEKLVGPEHAVRAIWELVGRTDLSEFHKGIGSVEGVAGRSAIDPRLLISLWVYGYSMGVNSAREISRMCDSEAGCQWLTGLTSINYHTLSDFRVRHGEGLRKVFEEVLGVLSAEGLVKLERVMHDGTKIRACASGDTFRREERVEAHLDLAREQVRLMEESDEEELSKRQVQGRRRAAREQEQRLELAIKELEKIQASKERNKGQQAARVSMTDPEARMMKQSDGGYAPSYNVQISVDAQAKIIAAVAVSQSGSDQGQLGAAVERVQQTAGRQPEQIVVDGGFVTRETILEMSQKQVELIGPVPSSEAQCAQNMKRRDVEVGFYPEDFQFDQQSNSYQCPAGKTLKHRTKKARRGYTQHIYAASNQDCQDCPLKTKCCPKTRHRELSRSVEGPDTAAFRERMQTSEGKAIYRQRGAVAEFPNAWIKSKLGLRQFRLRGLAKVGLEALWACLTYNIQQWIRLCWRAEMAG